MAAKDATTAAPIDFYFEFASPYGYFASLRIDRVAARHDRTVAWRPFLLGAVMKITGMAPFGSIPVRRDYFRRDVPRLARAYGMTVTMPDSMPMNGVAACRAFYWLVDEDPESAKHLARAVYDAHWREGRDMGDGEAVAEVATNYGIDREALLAGIQEPAVKQRLKDETDAAVAAGVFGSPYLIIDGEPFWGQDRLKEAERWLETGGW
ncbi:MAG: 2-hydroxychromene-2-carboxylate isomerase [Alphaproteobacteria bacterium]|jgi:2-hydroxychromene-2-carboxylate isomerase|nr:2-hydroxychromene-2-carboxylate isomerase [Alphaproteobacteria bacterium]MDP6517047.1 2-hydroxychromene-2-carboxylate isomerase [Alphaproteobacteria bacterium]